MNQRAELLLANILDRLGSIPGEDNPWRYWAWKNRTWRIRNFLKKMVGDVLRTALRKIIGDAFVKVACQLEPKGRVQ